jgi:hypothetical protein
VGGGRGGGGTGGRWEGWDAGVVIALPIAPHRDVDGVAPHLAVVVSAGGVVDVLAVGAGVIPRPSILQ